MVEVLEFKNVNEINNYLKGKLLPQFEIKPIARTFQHPESKLLVNSISYVLILNP
jgi:hypothetical protein